MVVAVNQPNRGSTHVATAQPVVKFTYEDYRTAPPDKRYELPHGDLVRAPAPNLKHQDVQVRLGLKLGAVHPGTAHALATAINTQTQSGEIRL